MTARGRLDTALVARGIARSRTQAQALVRDGRVQVDGIVATKVSQPVAADQQISVAVGRPGGESDWIAAGWVGRGALKLEHALAQWAPEGLSVAGRRCLDVGASTGGFTQVLLRRGAAHVVALDVGHGQLDPVLASHPDVTDLPGTNIRATTAETIGGTVDVVVGDVSFISVAHVLRVLPTLLSTDSDSDPDVVLLIKPQFEIGARRLGHDGVVRSPDQRQEVLRSVLSTVREVGLAPFGVLRSPVRGGAAGNIEYLVWARPCRPGMMDWGLSPQDEAAACAQLRTEEET